MLKISRTYNDEVSYSPRNNVDLHRQRVIEDGYKQIYTHARLLRLNGAQAVFKGISNIATKLDDYGNMRIASADMDFDLAYVTPIGPAKMKLIVDYLNGRYAVSDAVQAAEVNGTAGTNTNLSLDSVKEVTPQNNESRMWPNISEEKEIKLKKIQNMFNNNPYYRKKVVEYLVKKDPDNKIDPKAVIQILADMDESFTDEVIKLMENTPHPESNENTGSVRQAQQMEYGRPMQPIAYMAERIARMVEKMAGREPQAIYEDYVKCYPYMDDDLAIELADKVMQLGYFIKPIKVGIKGHVFSMPEEMKMQQDKYLGDDMNDPKFTDRFHDKSPEKEPQVIETAGDPRPKPKSIFASIIEDSKEYELEDE